MIVAIIPAYNEESSIGSVCAQVAQYVDRVIIIDDGSVDGTSQEVIDQHNSKFCLLRHQINLGKGAALRTGYEVAKRLGAEIVVLLDADGQHLPEYVPYIIDELKNKDKQAVFCFRKKEKKMPVVRVLGNFLINKTASVLFKIDLRDMLCGFRAFKMEVIPYIIWRDSGYFVEIEMALRFKSRNFSYSEIEIPTIYNDRFKGVTSVDGLKLLLQMIIWRIKL